jgi:two-component system, NarL family, response regulator LiaR
MTADQEPTAPTGARRIRVLLVDDHTILREGLRSLLALESDIAVVGDVGDGRSAVQAARKLTPDVVVMDIGMPGLNGVDATRQLLSGPCTSRVLCLSVHQEKSLVTAMLRAGASGYLLKTSAAKELVNAVRTVASGATYLSPPIAADVVDQHIRGRDSTRGGAYETLTERERQVLQLVAEGLNTKDIAARLHLSPKTVLAHRESLMRKLGVDSVVALARYAVREGVTDL